jgi:hypothetical protein
MTEEAPREEDALKTLKHSFGDRVKRGPVWGGGA